MHRKAYAAHRLAYLYMTGAFPPEQVDHKNLIKSDNRWDNLRLATGSQNAANRPVRSQSKSGVKGVWNVRDKFVSVININGKQKYLGTFTSEDEAHSAYMDAANAHYGEYARSA